MRFPPPEVMAAWPTPNYKDPETRGPALMIVELVALPLALICVVLRLYVRIHLIKRSGWDDWLMVAAVFFCCGVTISVILGKYNWSSLDSSPLFQEDDCADNLYETQQLHNYMVGISMSGT